MKLVLLVIFIFFAWFIFPKWLKLVFLTRETDSVSPEVVLKKHKDTSVFPHPSHPKTMRRYFCWSVFMGSFGHGSKRCHPWGPQVLVYFSFHQYSPIGFFRYPVFLTHSHFAYLFRRWSWISRGSLKTQPLARAFIATFCSQECFGKDDSTWLRLRYFWKGSNHQQLWCFEKGQVVCG